MKSRKIMENIGRFVSERDEHFYIDSTGKVWSQEMISDLVASHKAMKKTIDFIEHYKKFLEK